MSEARVAPRSDSVRKTTARSAVAGLLPLAVAGCGSQEHTASLPRRPAAGHSPQADRSSGSRSTPCSPATPRRSEPAPGVIPYDLNSALFSDYAEKFRFVKLPPGRMPPTAQDDAFEFPVGTVIAKTFAYPRDARDPSQGRRLIETRILKHDPDGWVGLALHLEHGADRGHARRRRRHRRRELDPHRRPHADQQLHHPQRQPVQGVPQVRRDHDADRPEGPPPEPRLRLSRGDGEPADPLGRLGALLGRRARKQAPRLAVWDDPKSGTLDARARAWLEINCAHCHTPQGPRATRASTCSPPSAIPTAFGINKPPVAAGIGSGGLAFDIVPGQPDQSILAYRIASTHPGVMMPELGKRLVHEEGVALVRQWIAAMRGPSARKTPVDSLVR